MAPSRRSTVLGAVAAVAAVALQGCFEAHISDFKHAVCKTTMESVVIGAATHYKDQVLEKCEALRNQLHQELLNANRSDDVYHQCLDKAGAHQTADILEQQDNFTQMCVDYISGSVGDNSSIANNWGDITGRVGSFLQDGNFEGQINNLLGEHLDTDIDQLKGQLLEGIGGEKGEKGEESGNKDDEKQGTDEKSSGEKEGTDEKSTGEKGGTDEKSTGEKEGTDEKSTGEKGGTDEKSTGEKGGEDAEKGAKGSTGDDEHASKQASRLFDASVHLPRSPRAAAVSAMVGAVLATTGLAVVLARKRARRDSSLETVRLVVDGEDSDFATA